MPNYKIPEVIRTEIKASAFKLVSRTLTYAQADFPLTVDQIQAMVLSHEHLATISKLEQQGINTISRYQRIRITFLRNNLAIRRGVVLRMELPDPGIFVPKATNYAIPSDSPFDPDKGHYLTPDFSRIDDQARESLIAWLDRLVRQKRMVEITIHAVNKIVDDCIPTTSHVHALWPTLATLVTNNNWKARFRNPTRSLRAYAPSTSVVNAYGKLIQVADIVFAAGEMLNDYEHDEDDVLATIEHWEPLEGDKTY